MPKPERLRASDPATRSEVDAVHGVCNRTRDAQSFPDLLEAFHVPGAAHLDPVRIAGWLGIPLQDLAALAGVHRNTVRLHPAAPKLQSTLLALVRLLSATARCQGGVEGAAFHVRNTPVPRFHHKTLLQLVEEGRVEEAIGYVESVLPGFLWTGA